MSLHYYSKPFSHFNLAVRKDSSGKVQIKFLLIKINRVKLKLHERYNTQNGCFSKVLFNILACGTGENLTVHQEFLISHSFS